MIKMNVQETYKLFDDDFEDDVIRTKDDVDNVNVCLSESILNVGVAFTKYSKNCFNQMLKMFIFVVNNAGHDKSSSDKCSVSFDAQGVTNILGYQKLKLYYPEAKDFIMKFVNFVNSQEVLHAIGTTDPIIVKTKCDNTTLTVLKSNPIIQKLTAEDKRLALFKFRALNRGQARHYVMLFLDLALCSRQKRVQYTSNQWKYIFNLSPKTTTTRLKA